MNLGKKAVAPRGDGFLNEFEKCFERLKERDDDSL
jgi:hypothetical protein